MLNILLSVICWNAFKASSQNNTKMRRYNLVTNFAKK